MTDSNSRDADRPFFSAVLIPHRSLGRRGYLVLMVAVSLVCFTMSLAFTLMGAWPIAGFVGLDVALVWFAFHVNYRSARAFEEVEVSSTEVLIRKVSPAGRSREYRFNPFWSRLQIEEAEDEGVTRIALLSRGRAVDVGGFLNPEDRTSFASAFRSALATARSGGPMLSGA